MRVPDSSTYDRAIRYMNEAKAKYDELSEIAATGKNFQQSSDDPSLVSSALTLRSSVSTIESYSSSSSYAQDFMENSETAYGLMNDLISDANTIMLSAMSDTVSSDERVNDYAVQLKQILNQAISVANSSYNGSYLFSGTKVDTKPFTLAADESSVEYSGNTSTMKSSIAPGVSITINSDGVSAFNDFFNSVIQAIDGLENDDSTTMDSALTAINDSLTTMNKYRTNNSAILKQLDTNISHLATTKTELNSLLTIKEDANMTEAISLANLQLTTYETVIDVCSRTISATSLFDVLF
jgi:flagellar hook-associated protein 3 FlgL